MTERFGIRRVPTRFSYTVSYGKDVDAHDFDSDLKRELRCSMWFQHVIHGVLHSTVPLGLSPRLQRRELTRYCGAGVPRRA